MRVLDAADRYGLPNTLAGLLNRLNRGGVLYASFKYGTGEQLRSGRLFVDMDEDGLQHLAAAPGVGAAVLGQWTSEDARPERTAEERSSVLLRRP